MAPKVGLEPEGSGGKTLWMGGSPGLSFKLAQSMKQIAADDILPIYLSKRAIDGLKEIRSEFAWIRAGYTHILPANENGRAEWWTFGGQQINDTFASLLRHHCQIQAEPEGLLVRLRVGVIQARECIERLRGLTDAEMDVQFDPEAELSLKFAEILPNELKARLVNGRAVNVILARQLLAHPVKSVFINQEQACEL